jgi:hypothetical protein
MTGPNLAPRNANGESVERAKFEESLVAMHMATGMPEDDARSFLEVGSMGYTSTFTKAAWWAWQESRKFAALFRSRKDLIIKVFHPGDEDEPFICAVNGEVTVDALAGIEEELKGEHEFSSGPGDYTYAATYDDGQYDEMGRCELAPYWELTEIAFEKQDCLVDEAEASPAPSSDEPCDDCGDTLCGFKHHCHFPF